MANEIKKFKIMKLIDISKNILQEGSIDKDTSKIIRRMIDTIKQNNSGWNVDVLKNGTGFTVSMEINGVFFKNNILNFHYSNKAEIQLKLSEIISMSDPSMNENDQWLIKLKDLTITVFK